MPEVDDAELARLRQAAQVLQTLNGDPASRAHLETALKVKYPHVETEAEVGARLAAPHLERFQAEVATPLMDELKAMREERQAAAARETEANLNAAFATMRRERGFTDDGIEAVKKLMVDNNIADPMAAAARFQELNPPAPEPTTGFAPPSWNYAETVSDQDIAGLMKDPDSWGDKMAAQALNEIRMGNAA